MIVDSHAIDTHVHVVDPARFPPPPGPGYKPVPQDHATGDDLSALFRGNGVTGALIVQLSGYGTDNRSVLDAAARSRGRWRAVVQVEAGISEAGIAALAEAGAAGVRFNVGSLGPEVLDGCERLFPLMARHGMIAQIHCAARDLVELAPRIAGAPCRLLFDHLGLPDIAAGPAEPGFRRLLEFGRDGAVIKLSGAFRSSRRPFPHEDLDPFLAEILDAFAPENRVFGSDFPFVKLDPKPRYVDTLAMLRRWIPDPREQGLALAANPRRIFGLPD